MIAMADSCVIFMAAMAAICAGIMAASIWLTRASICDCVSALPDCGPGVAPA